MLFDYKNVEDAQLLTSLKFETSWNVAANSGELGPKRRTQITNSRGCNLSSDEKSKRSRERNKIHARLTRVRKKNAAQALQDYLFYLWSEVQFLRQMQVDLDTSMSLIQFSKSKASINGKNQSELRGPDLEQCLFNDISGHLDLKLDDLENFKSMLETHLRSIANASLDTVVFPDPKSRKNDSLLKLGGLSPQEINKLHRRERNRLHAKLTRDRKKIIHKLTEKSIKELEQDATRLRHALLERGFPLLFYKDKLVYGSRLDCLHHVVSTPNFKNSLGLNNVG